MIRWILIFLLLILAGCQGGGNSSTSTVPTQLANVAGEVFNAATSDEVSEALVTLAGVSTTTDQEGRYSFSGLVPGTYPISTAKAGYSGYNGTVTVSAGTTELDNLPLYPPGWAGTIKGQVISGETGLALTGVLVSIGETTTLTGAGGNYTLDHVPPTHNDITASKAGYNDASSTFTVVPDASVTVNFTMFGSGKSGLLTGTVKESGTITVIGGVSVSGANQTSLTQNDGNYTLSLPAGTQKVTAAKNLYAPQTASAVVLPSTNTTQNFNLTLSQQFMRKRPYLIFTGKETEMAVTWQTFHTPTSSKIEWGETVDYKGGSATVTENSAAADEHILSHTITGLKAATRYYYRVRVDNNTFESVFVTAPEKTATRVVFYGYGDTRTQVVEHDLVLKAVLDDMALDNTVERHTFMLHGGDFVSRGLMEEYWDEEFFNPGNINTQQFLARIPILGTLGNHECYKDVPGKGCVFDSKNGGKLYRKYWPYPGYPLPNRFHISYDYGPVHIASVDAYMHPTLAPGQEEYDWLDKDLEKSDRRWKIVVIHQPIYASTQYSATLDKDLLDLLQKRGVKLVMQSHAHYYSRVDAHGIQYVTLGGGGAGLAPCTPYDRTSAKYPIVATSQYNFGRFEADDKSLKMTALNVTGGKIDEFEIK